MYTIREASSRSGVGIPLLRAWERRYRVVEPTRTPAGYRLYDDEAIERLRAMRLLIADGWSAHLAAERVRTAAAGELSGPLSIARPAPMASAPGPIEATMATALVDRMVAAARAIDAPAIEAILDEAYAMARFEAATDAVVMPGLRAIGEAWVRKEVDVAGEHAASHAVLRRFAMAYEAAGDSPLERTLLVGLGPGGQHELAAFAFAVAARRAGLPVLYLGPNLPAESWVSAADRRDAFGAVVGVPTTADARGAQAVIGALRTARPGMLLAVGGAGAPRVARATGAVELPSESIARAVAAVRRADEAQGAAG
jgi:DNA-binding transcriptional MerR regulator